MKQVYRVGGYVKLAKLWEKKRASAMACHAAYFEARCRNDDAMRLVDIYVDITGNKQVYKRLQMVRLLKACLEGQIDTIVTPTRAYLAPNTEEFCYLIRFILDMPGRVDIVTDDDDYRVDTILNVEDQRESLYEMASRFIRLKPDAYEQWKKQIMKAIDGCQEKCNGGENRAEPGNGRYSG